MYYSTDYYKFDEYFKSLHKVKGDWHWLFQI